MQLGLIEFEALGTPAFAATAKSTPQRTRSVALRTKPVIVAPP
jgi:hypothetical protein